jgi:hypothetical protein
MDGVRPFRDGDGPGVAALLEDSAPGLYRWKLNAMHGPGRDEPSRWRTKGRDRPGANAARERVPADLRRRSGRLCAGGAGAVVRRRDR